MEWQKDHFTTKESDPVRHMVIVAYRDSIN